jgi:hypothetical protein
MTVAVVAPVAQPLEPDAISEALRAALARALPFPEARADATAPGGATDPVWTVRWPAAGEPRIEVLANPLNPGNRERALRAEAEIQKAVLASQRKSQADYDRAVSDFERIGRVGEIREVTLGDEGVAGERYDAESQLTIRAEVFEGRHAFTVATSQPPEPHAVSGGPSMVVRVPANTYQVTHFCPEQAWVYFGAVTPPAISVGDASAAVSIDMAPGASRGVVVSIGGNAELVNRVLQQADWESFRARVAG